MPLPATDIIVIHDDVRSLLNDTFSDIFTDVILLPFTRRAYQEFQDELAINGIETVLDQDYTFVVNAGIKEITTPTDLIMPLEMWEKPATLSATDQDYVLMMEKKWEPDLQLADSLRFWHWMEDRILVPGATTARTVKVKYNKFLLTIFDITSTIPIVNCRVWMASRVAAIAALAVGANSDRSQIYQADANMRLAKLMQIAVKRNQLLGTRRQPSRQFS